MSDHRLLLKGSRSLLAVCLLCSSDSRLGRIGCSRVLEGTPAYSRVLEGTVACSRQLKDDCSFLEANDFIDYSILVLDRSTDVPPPPPPPSGMLSAAEQI